MFFLILLSHIHPKNKEEYKKTFKCGFKYKHRNYQITWV